MGALELFLDLAAMRTPPGEEREVADRLLAELRGVIDERGGSPFWDGVAGRFFGMSFQEADYFNAINGNQFIADLMPKHPV